MRSTAQPKLKGGRRRPDPLLVVTAELWAWFDADPSRTRRELLKRLQAEPGQLRRLLRTLQRHV
jgi:phage gp16-like protein